MSEPKGLDQFLGASQGDSPEPQGLNDFLGEEQYGSLPQQALAGVEGVARGATLGASDFVEPALGLSTKEAIKGRMDQNPVTSFGGSVLGGAGLVAATGGLAAPIEGAVGAGLAGSALGLGAEGAAFGAGNAVSDAALGDGNLSAQKVLANMGMGAVLGVGAAGLGAGAKSILGRTGLIKGSVADELANTAEKASSDAPGVFDRTYKENAPDIVEAANNLGAPLTPGMVSDNPYVQKAESALINSAPTYNSVLRNKQYSEGYSAVEKAITDITGAPESEGGLSKAQLGNAVGDSLSSKIANESAPIGQLYDAVKEVTKDIPINTQSLGRIADNLSKLDEVRLSPSSPAGQLVNGLVRDLDNVKTVDDLKSFRKILSGRLSPTASPSEKYVLGQIQDRLSSLEERTIQSHSENLMTSIIEKAPKDPAELAEYEKTWMPTVEKISGLLEQKKQADALYKPFITKVKTLAKMFGKKNVSGAQGAIDFIQNDLKPEMITQKLSAKNNSEGLAFFAKEFPEEHALWKQYEFSKLRDAAVNQRTGAFDPRVFTKKVFALEPETRASLFAPDELEKLSHVRTYLRSIPTDFNPSHSGDMHAFREFYKSPIAAAVANARDFGIDQYITRMGQLPDHLRPGAEEIGQAAGDAFNKLTAAQAIQDKTDQSIYANVRSIFSSVDKKTAASAAALVGATSLANGSFDDKTKRIEELANSPETLMGHMANHTEGLDKALPAMTQGIHSTILNSVQFLNSKIPRPPNTLPLNQEFKPTTQQKQKFDKYYDAVNNPVGVLGQVKQGRISSEALEALSVAHPQLLNQMRSAISDQLKMNKAKSLPYSVKLSMGKFLGQPLDSSMLPQVVQSNQAIFQSQPQSQSQGQPKPRASSSGLQKLNVASRAGGISGKP